MHQTRYVIGNWKLHKSKHEAVAFAHAFFEKAKQYKGVQIGIAPTAVCIESLKKIDLPIMIGAQTCSNFDEGSYTGEISARMLRELGSDFVIIGHSERRRLFGESDEDVNKKIVQAVTHDLKVILCVGEEEEELSVENLKKTLSIQLHTALENLSDEKIGSLMIAYEPIWAIGRGYPASIVHIHRVANTIREILSECIGNKGTNSVPLLYGGSVTKELCIQLHSCLEVNGVLVGGASLEVDHFIEIIALSEIR